MSDDGVIFVIYTHKDDRCSSGFSKSFGVSPIEKAADLKICA